MTERAEFTRERPHYLELVKWHIASLPWEYCPPGIDKMNSYAVHGLGIGRTYEILYSMPCEEIEEGQGSSL